MMSSSEIMVAPAMTMLIVFSMSLVAAEMPNDSSDPPFVERANATPPASAVMEESSRAMTTTLPPSVVLIVPPLRVTMIVFVISLPDPAPAPAMPKPPPWPPLEPPAPPVWAWLSLTSEPATVITRISGVDSATMLTPPSASMSASIASALTSVSMSLSPTEAPTETWRPLLLPDSAPGSPVLVEAAPSGPVPPS